MVGQEYQQHPRDLSSFTLGRPYAGQQITRELLPYLPTDRDQTLKQYTRYWKICH